MENLRTNEIFTFAALDQLYIEVDRVSTVEDFFLFVDEVARNPHTTLKLSEHIDFATVLEPKDEGNNASRIFEAVRPRDLANAADPRLWSYLSLVTFREYMRERWNVDNEKFASTIKDHWLLTKRESRRFMRHGVSRLWWVAHHTIDPNLTHPLSSNTGDPFAYTKWTFQSSRRIQGIFERNIGRSSTLLWPLMEELQEWSESKGSESERDFFKLLNLHSGVKRIEALNETEIRSLIKDLMVEVDQPPER